MTTYAHAATEVIESQRPTPFELVYSRLASNGSLIAEKNNGWFSASCPCHWNHKNGDRSASFGFREHRFDNGETMVIVSCLAGCDKSAIMQALGLEWKAFYSNSASSHADYMQKDKKDLYSHKKALSLIEYAEAMKLPLEFLQMEMGLADDVFTFHKSDGTSYLKKGVSIPYLYRDGTRHERAKLRLGIKKGDGKDDRFMVQEGDDALIPYGLQMIPEMERFGYGIIVEGESDTQTLLYHQIPAIGIPGTSNFKLLDPSMLSAVPKLYIMQEKTDQSGKDFPYKVQGHLRDGGYTGEIVRIPLLNICKEKDPSALQIRLVTENAGTSHSRFLEEWQKAMDQAKEMKHDTGSEEILPEVFVGGPAS